jgi:hypothetical protein
MKSSYLTRRRICFFIQNRPNPSRNAATNVQTTTAQRAVLAKSVLGPSAGVQTPLAFVLIGVAHATEEEVESEIEAQFKIMFTIHGEEIQDRDTPDYK